MTDRPMLLASCAIVAVTVYGCDNRDAGTADHTRITYNKDVAPILQKYCAECHLPGMPGAAATGFTVDSYAAVMKETQYGPVVEPGSSMTSSLYNMVAGKDRLAVSMPHGREPLGDDEIAIIQTWIDDGAVEN